MKDVNAFDEEVSSLSFIDDDEEACFRTAVLGTQTISFLETDLGRMIRRYAIADIKIAQGKLVNVDAADIEKVRKLQMEANVPAALLAYIEEIIANGEQAEQELKQRQQERGINT